MNWGDLFGEFSFGLGVITYRGLGELKAGESGSEFGLALGVFDGFHLGHQAVIDAARGAGRVGVLTFDPPPVEILAPGRKAPRKIIGSLAHQERVLAELKVDFLVVVEFTREFAAVSGREFADELAATGVKRLAAGHDWSFGKGRSGNVDLLDEWVEGIEVFKVEPVCAGEERISSSSIRVALEEGDLEKAARLLGREYYVFGEVQQGKQLGRTLGFPTANVAVAEELLPANGVYAVTARWENHQVSGVANVGTRPTVDASMKRNLEVHLFSNDVPDAYGWMLEVGFTRKIRAEKKFNGIDELKAQIIADIAAAKSKL